MTMKIGTLIYWNSRFGFIEVRIPEPIGIKIERYFLHHSRIVLEPETIHEGQSVRFVVRAQQPQPGKLPYAGDAEIFESMEQLQDAEKGSEGSAA
jgi:cold shock CspA family protein